MVITVSVTVTNTAGKIVSDEVAQVDSNWTVSEAAGLMYTRVGECGFIPRITWHNGHVATDLLHQLCQHGLAPVPCAHAILLPLQPDPLD